MQSAGFEGSWSNSRCRVTASSVHFFNTFLQQALQLVLLFAFFVRASTTNCTVPPADVHQLLSVFNARPLTTYVYLQRPTCDPAELRRKHRIEAGTKVKILED